MIVTAFVVVALAALPVTGFLLIFALTVPWYRTSVGRGLLLAAVGNALLVHLILWFWTFGDDEIRHPLAAFLVFAVLTPAYWIQFLALVAAKLRRDDHSH